MSTFWRFGIFKTWHSGVSWWFRVFVLHTELSGFTRYRSLIEMHSSSNIALSH
jgi:hypothetical protein